MTARVILNALAVLHGLDSATGDPWTSPQSCQADIFLRIDAVAARAHEMSPWLVLIVSDAQTTNNTLTVSIFLHPEGCAAY